MPTDSPFDLHSWVRRQYEAMLEASNLLPTVVEIDREAWMRVRGGEVLIIDDPISEVLSPESEARIRQAVARWYNDVPITDLSLGFTTIDDPFRELPSSNITQGSPEYMQSLVSQVSEDTLARWLSAWSMPEGSTRSDLAARVLDYGQGDAVSPEDARELSRLIMADVGIENIEGARRADRNSFARHYNPDTAEDLDHHDGVEEPLEDSEWFRDLAMATEKRMAGEE